MRHTPQRLSRWVFLLLLASFAFWGVRNHRLKFDSDPSSYLRFAAALARGSMYLNYPPDKVFEGYYPPSAVFKGTYSTLIHEGRGMAYYSIGYPLFLSLFILVGGRYAPFFANLLAFLALLVLMRAVTARLFRGHPAAPAAALLAPALYWCFARSEISYLLAPYRDPLAHALLLGAILACIRWLEEPERLRSALVGSLLLGLAIMVRETAVLAALPIGLYSLRSMVVGRWFPSGRAIGTLALGVGIGVLPLLVQNYRNTGNPLYPTQMLEDQVRYGVVTDIDEDKPVQMKGLRLAYFPRTAPGVVREVFRNANPVFIVLFAAGLLAGRSNPTVWFLFVPFVAVHALFFGCYIRTMWRYVFIAQLAAVPIVAFGLAAGASRLGRAVRVGHLAEVVAAGTLVVTAGVLAVRDEGRTFRVPEAEAFRRDLEALVPAGAVVLAERPLRDVIDLTTHANGVRVEEIVREEVGLPVATALAFLERSSPGLFFLDSRDNAQKKGFDQTPVTRESILSRYDLTPVGSFEAVRYGLGQEFGRPRVTLYRVEPWRAPESLGSAHVGAGGAGVLRVNGREIVPGGGEVAAEIFLGGQRVGSSLASGLNWFFTETAPATGSVPVRVVAAMPLPRDMAPVWYPADSPIDLLVGPDVTPLDRSFLSRDFIDPRDRLGERVLEHEGEARVPALPVPGTQLILAARIGPDFKVPGQRVSFSAGEGAAEEFIVQGPGVMRTVSFPIAGPDPGKTTATVKVRPFPLSRAPQGPRQTALLVDRLTVSRLPLTGPPLRIGFGPATEPYLREGVYEAEMHLDRHVVRWTDGSARMHLPASARAADESWRFTLLLFGPPAGVAAPRLRIAVNTQGLGEFPLLPNSAQTVSCVVPRGLLRPGLNDLEVQSTPWTPAQLFGSEDARTLGVMLEELEIVRGGESP